MATFEASFKKRRSGKLIWVECEAETNKEATEKLRAYVNFRHAGYRLYGGPMIQKQQAK